MGKVIKVEKTRQLIRELARLTGESDAAALATAVHERLERVRGRQGIGLSARLLAIGKDCATRLKEPYRSAEHGDLLYGKDGLPL